MWIVTIYTCILIFPSTLTTPLKRSRREADESIDDFYKGLQSTLEKLVDAPETLQQDDDSGDDDAEVAEQSDDSQLETKLKREEDPVESEVKLKRDESAAIRQRTPEKPESGFFPSCLCDRYEKESHSCINIRQIGTTLTLGVQFSMQEKLNRIRWFRYFKRRGSLPEVKKEFTKDNSPWNINIGGQNNELRISPVTEIDFSFNYFVAIIDDAQQQQKSQKQSSSRPHVRFVIEPIHIDMGSLYPGEELVVYARAFMELPTRSVALEWSMSEKDFHVRYDLPSNMKIVAEGEAVIVKELTTSKDKVLTCSVFSNKNIFLARRDFLFRKIDGSNKKERLLHASNFKRRRRSIEENEGFEEDDAFYEDTKPSFNDLGAKNRPYRQYSSIDSTNTQLAKTSDYLKHPVYRSDIDKFDFRENKLPIKSEQPPNQEETIFLVNEDEYRVPQSEPENSLRRSLYDKSRRELYSMEEKLDSGKSSWSRNRQRRLPGVLTEEIKPLNNVPEKNPGFEPYHQRGSRRINSGLNDPTVDSEMEEKRDLPTYNQKTVNANAYGLDRLIRQANDLVQSPAKKPNSEDETKEISNNNEKYTYDDIESEFIANCQDDFDCSLHAICLKKENGDRFCRCRPRYNGNGIFCWLL